MDFSYVQSLMPAIFQGLKNTLIIFFGTLVFALPLGLPIAFGCMSRFTPLRAVSNAYVWVFRGTPLMLQLFFFYFALPQILGHRLFDVDNSTERLLIAVLTFVLNYAAYLGEIYRSGIQSIDRGQREAAKSLGFSPWQTMRKVVIPQAVRTVIPPVSNEVITLIKDTALVYVIGVPEMLKAAKDANNRDVDPTAYLIVAVVYLCLTFVLTMISQKLEVRFSRHERRDAV